MDAHHAAVSLVEITRGQLVESLHRGFIAAVDAEGRIIARLGEVETHTWYRSAAKPFQAIPLIAIGAADYFGLTPQELAVISASHSGEDIHLETVGAILKKIGFSEADLLCGTHQPYDELAARKLQTEQKSPSQLHNNCSGKHSGMLAFAKFIGQPISDYINPLHPIQQQILSAIAQFSDVPISEIAIAVDGCSAPVFGTSVLAMACSFARLVGSRYISLDPTLAAAAERIVEAMTEFPEMVGGSRGRLDTDLMKAAQKQIVSKVGAEGVQLLGVKPCKRYPKGLGIAIKIEDGDTRRARDPVVIETLRQLGVLSEEQVKGLAAYLHTPLFNHRKLEVGKVRPCFQL
ncbi:MAG: asparaginase [Acidobacteria bacterium]|nr:asparaginase [Acidobacteriota bacterium]